MKSIDVSKFASDMIVEHQFKNGEHIQNFKSYKPIFVVVDEMFVISCIFVRLYLNRSKHPADYNILTPATLPMSHGSFGILCPIF